MPEVEAVETICCGVAVAEAEPVAVGHAGGRLDGLGRHRGAVGEGRGPRTASEATTAGALAPAMLAVKAADRRASGTSAVTRRRRPARGACCSDIR